jgi:hypothetical protein
MKGYMIWTKQWEGSSTSYAVGNIDTTDVDGPNMDA